MRIVSSNDEDSEEDFDDEKPLSAQQGKGKSLKKPTQVVVKSEEPSMPSTDEDETPIR